MAVTLSLPLPPPPRSPKMPRFTSPVSFFGLSVFRVYLLAILVFTLPTLTQANLSTCVTNYDPNTDYFPDKVVVTEAEEFSVQYFKHYKLVTNAYTKETFALYQCGTPVPTGLNATVKVFSIPLQTIAVTQTTDISSIEALGMRTKVKLVEGPQYFSSPCVQKMITTGAAQELTSPYENKTIYLQQLETVDAVFVFSADATNPKSISVSNSNDPGALHRAEWIDFFATFFNAEARANEYFANVTDRYSCVSNLASEYTAVQPKIAWVSYSSYSTNKYFISKAAYKLEFVKDLGAIPVFYEVDSFATAAEWQTKMADVDIAIDETYLGTIDKFLTNFNLTRSSDFKFIKNEQVWSFDKLVSELGALDWFEGAMVNPDAVLEDLLTIAKPGASFPHTRIWFRNSIKGEGQVVQDEGKCPDPTVIPSSKATPCSQESSDASFAGPAALAVTLLAALVLLFA